MLLVMKPEEAKKLTEAYQNRCQFNIEAHTKMVAITNDRIANIAKRGGNAVWVDFQDYRILFDKELIPHDINAKEVNNYLNKLAEVFRLAGYNIEDDNDGIYKYRISWK